MLQTLSAFESSFLPLSSKPLSLSLLLGSARLNGAEGRVKGRRDKVTRGLQEQTGGKKLSDTVTALEGAVSPLQVHRPWRVLLAQLHEGLLLCSKRGSPHDPSMPAPGDSVGQGAAQHSSPPAMEVTADHIFQMPHSPSVLTFLHRNIYSSPSMLHTKHAVSASSVFSSRSFL